MPCGHFFFLELFFFVLKDDGYTGPLASLVKLSGAQHPVIDVLGRFGLCLNYFERRIIFLLPSNYSQNGDQGRTRLCSVAVQKTGAQFPLNNKEAISL